MENIILNRNDLALKFMIAMLSWDSMLNTDECAALAFRHADAFILASKKVN